MASLDGKKVYKNILFGKKTEAKQLGIKAATDILKKQMFRISNKVKAN